MFVEVLDCDKVSLKPFESILNSKALSFCQYHTNIVFDQITPTQIVLYDSYHHPSWKTRMVPVSLLPNIKVELRAIRCPFSIK